LPKASPKKNGVNLVLG